MLNKKEIKEPIFYKEGTLKEDVVKKKYNEPLIYEPVKNERINVLLHIVYPSYDFIFGVPDKSNPYYKDEVGFFQFRDTREKRVRQGFYVDCCELEGIVNGFKSILDFSKSQRPDIWKKYKKNKALEYDEKDKPSQSD